MKPSILIGIVILLALTGGVFYYYNSIGGFEEVKVTEKSNVRYLIQGKAFKGNVKTEPLFRQLFDNTEAFLKVNPKGYLCAYFKQVPTKENDFEADAIIGALVQDTTELLNDEYKNFAISFDYTLHAYKAAPPTVAGETEETLHTYAKEHHFRLENAVLEHYISQQEFAVEIPVSQ